MRLMLVDTEAIVMHLIRRVAEGRIKISEYTCEKIYHKMVMELENGWVATLIVDHVDQVDIPAAHISLRKQGLTDALGFLYKHRTPLMFEYAKDFCISIRDTYHPAVRTVLKEALPDLNL